MARSSPSRTAVLLAAVLAAGTGLATTVGVPVEAASPSSPASPAAVHPQLDPTTLACIGGPQALADLASGKNEQSIPKSDPKKQIAAIATWVQKERALRFTKQPASTFVTQQQIEGRMKASFAKDYPASEARADGELLAALGAVPPRSDLAKMQSDLVGGQVAGYYDDDSGELVVLAVKPGAALKAMEQITLSHELEHALADQAIGLPNLDKLPPARADERTATISLIEGDATATMQRFAVQQVSMADQLALLSDPLLGKQSAELEKYPQFLQKSLTFPYEEGLNFVCGLLAKGGWDAVDKAYKKPPVTTAQILFPERYAADERPIDPRDPPAPAAPWKRTRTMAVGAADLLFLFQAPGDKTTAALPNARRLVAAWAGGEATQFRNGDGTGSGSAVVVGLVQRKGSTGLCASVSRWYKAAFPSARTVATQAGETFALDGTSQDAVLRCAGDEVRLGIAPDLATARTLSR